MATKIKRSIIKNVKNIDEFDVELNGATAYIIGGNTKGKTTFCSFLFDRLRSQTNDQRVLKNKDKEGIAEIEMTDGCKFRYEISPSGREKLTYVFNGTEIKATKEIINKYIGKEFDIDEFLQLQPKQKVDYLCKLYGVDVSELQKHLVEKISERRILKNEFEKSKALFEQTEQPSLQEIDIEAIKKQKELYEKQYIEELQKIKATNEKLRNEYQSKLEALFKEISEHNENVRKSLIIAEKANKILSELREIYLQTKDKNIENAGFLMKTFVDSIKIDVERNFELEKSTIPQPKLFDEPVKSNEYDLKLQEAIQLNSQVQIATQRYNDLKQKYENDKANVELIEKEIKDIEAKIKKELEKVNLPEGFTIVEGELFYNNYPVSHKHLSTSELYIASMKLSSISLKELRVLHFDCSTLDKNSMKDVLNYAKENDLQLLIERPDFDGGELRFEIVEEE